ncbi:MAG: hypothetical protein HQ581_14255 [Planctomycetes bacterium]|nr:hypothetical protein [Planctomycetota bacterium]
MYGKLVVEYPASDEALGTLVDFVWAPLSAKTSTPPIQLFLKNEYLDVIMSGDCRFYELEPDQYELCARTSYDFGRQASSTREASCRVEIKPHQETHVVVYFDFYRSKLVLKGNSDGEDSPDFSFLDQ